uniref:Uncharacterized protein n=1 Tax=Lepeophtheirus salmonis TaxID=72036 RepID=A0A0K2VKD8_LEPSM
MIYFTINLLLFFIINPNDPSHSLTNHKNQ